MSTRLIPGAASTALHQVNGATETVPENAVTIPPTAAVPPRTTFYRRSLPDTCVAFSSAPGRRYFGSAMETRGLKSYFHLMEQYTTQSEPAFCGISTLVISLNALAVDPRQIWKGSWRWYEESMLNCCIDLEQAKETGITMTVRSFFGFGWSFLEHNLAFLLLLYTRRRLLIVWPSVKAWPRKCITWTTRAMRHWSIFDPRSGKPASRRMTKRKIRTWTGS